MTKRNIITFCGITLIVLAVVTGFSYQRTNHDADMVPIEAEAFQIRDGWGYQVKIDGRPYIYQDMIPGVDGHRTFRSKENALKVGNVVVQKLMNHKIPSMSQEELLALHIPEAQ
ncbi:DUF4907 domain-containing protein [Chitinophaga arvensicola]|uniref:DUF4907 domain-containing protein n=1 Tax=Chitinophaga arvensicola TaxID=29529 RepID=A0A1I0SCH2_9BACT|nr:DUF4907 domain-containing protein [Chitinophaga arvensicola]SEW54856.1 protein of unknown function [Chitinophaga arvensicola]